MNLINFDDVSRITVIGTGTIGASWAAWFLAKGFTVSAWDPGPGAKQRASELIKGAWPALTQLVDAAALDWSQFNWCNELSDALKDTHFIQESAPERLDEKRALYQKMGPHLPDNIVMSTSTSGLLLSDLQDGQLGCERYVLGHPFNPPHLIPLVEVLGGKQTDPRVVDWTYEFYERIGKVSVRLNKEVPGHLANRMQAAIWREAIDAVVSGLASVEDVDKAIANGPGLRWALMGPHRTFHLAGGPGGMDNFIDHFGPANESWWATMNANVKISPAVKQTIVQGVNDAVGNKTMDELVQTRDQKLLDLLVTLRSHDK